MSINVGDIVECSVINITSYGAFVQLEDNKKGLIHISEVSNRYVEDANTVLKVGQVVKAKVLSIDNGKISLSIKQLEKPHTYKREFKEQINKKSETSEPKTFEDILSKLSHIKF